MIIRIMGEGQFEVDDSVQDRLNELDNAVESAVDADDDEAFGTALAALLDEVRALGSPLALDSLEDSDLVLPPSDASLHEVREILGDEGLIPG